MNRSELQRSIERSAGGSMVSISDLVRWSGRSREYIRNLTNGLDFIGSPTCKLFFSGDIAAAIIERKTQ